MWWTNGYTSEEYQQIIRLCLVWDKKGNGIQLSTVIKLFHWIRYLSAFFDKRCLFLFPVVLKKKCSLLSSSKVSFSLIIINLFEDKTIFIPFDLRICHLSTYRSIVPNIAQACALSDAISTVWVVWVSIYFIFTAHALFYADIAWHCMH